MGWFNFDSNKHAHPNGDQHANQYSYTDRNLTVHFDTIQHSYENLYAYHHLYANNYLYTVSYWNSYIHTLAYRHAY